MRNGVYTRLGMTALLFIARLIVSSHRRQATIFCQKRHLHKAHPLPSLVSTLTAP